MGSPSVIQLCGNPPHLKLVSSNVQSKRCLLEDLARNAQQKMPPSGRLQSRGKRGDMIDMTPKHCAYTIPGKSSMPNGVISTEPTAPSRGSPRDQNCRLDVRYESDRGDFERFLDSRPKLRRDAEYV